MDKEKLEEAYICKTCGKIAGVEHLCNPVMREATTCQYCGLAVEEPWHMCIGKLQKMQYFCTQCGRIAVDELCLCRPEKIS